MRRGFLQDLGTNGFGEQPSPQLRHARAGMRPGFLQARGSRGFGEDRSPQETSSSSIPGVSGIRQVSREDISPQQTAQARSRILRMPGTALPGEEASNASAFRSPQAASLGAGAQGASASTPTSAIDPRSWSVRKLKAVLRAAHVPHDDCLEKDDLVRRCLDCRADLDASSHEYDVHLAVGSDGAGATRLPRSFEPAAASSAAARGDAFAGAAARRFPARPWSPTASAAASVLSDDWLSAGRRRSGENEFGTDVLRASSTGRVESLVGRLPGILECAHVLCIHVRAWAVTRSCSQHERPLSGVLLLLGGTRRAHVLWNRSHERMDTPLVQCKSAIRLRTPTRGCHVSQTAKEPGERGVSETQTAWAQSSIAYHLR